MSYAEQMQKIVGKYRDEGEAWPASAKVIAAWAITNGLWKAQPSSIISQCADHLARAMREEYYTDPQGRKVRVKHVAIFKRDGEQLPLWGDIRSESRDFMERSLQQRRHAIVGDCRQLKNDADSYNENTNKGEQIRLVFDFAIDLKELELAA